MMAQVHADTPSCSPTTNLLVLTDPLQGWHLGSVSQCILCDGFFDMHLLRHSQESPFDQFEILLHLHKH